MTMMDNFRGCSLWLKWRKRSKIIIRDTNRATKQNNLSKPGEKVGIFFRPIPSFPQVNTNSDNNQN